MEAVLYIRVSTSEQHLGPQAQRDAAELWAKAAGVTIRETFIEQGVSGGKGMGDLELDLDQRPELLLAIDAIREGDILLVAKRDRLARDTILAGLIERLIARKGAKIVSADGAGNGDGPEAQLLRNIVNAFAEYERLLIKARTKSALAVKKSKGERTGQIPYGKRLASDGRHLIDHAVEQKVIQKIVALSRQGLSRRAIANRLNTEGIPARGRPGRTKVGTWRHPIVGRIIAQAA
ncbi:MAG: resolvase [Gemmatimonadetes bacterium]|nr:resolvase [Gemmatimonadota bacterium]|tara:strand:+ start:174 stop:878 length:705 start_codon:yes stop_codon:yes gene_type:complete